MSTASLVVLALLWHGVMAVFPVSVMAMVTLYKDSAITRLASATVPTTPKAHTVSPACLDTTETPGESDTLGEVCLCVEEAVLIFSKTSADYCLILNLKALIPEKVQFYCCMYAKTNEECCQTSTAELSLTTFDVSAKLKRWSLLMCYLLKVEDNY